MKSIKYFLISIILLLSGVETEACWEPWYTPGGYYMYRVYESMPVESDADVAERMRQLNCQAWQALTSKEIPIADIDAIVYGSSLKDFEDMRKGNSSVYESNKFFKWITEQDTTILNFLYLAKNTERVREQRNSRWYYPTMKSDASMTLEEIAEKSLAVRDNRLRDRYLLQAVRALFTLARYQECVDLWDNEVSLLPDDNLMRQHIYPYIVGAHYHIKRSEKAVEYFAQLGDVKSMLYCMGRDGEKITNVEAIEMVCEYAPNSEHVAKALQNYVRSIEPDGGYEYEKVFEKTTQTEHLYRLSLKMAKDRRVENPAMWHYTAAFIADLNGDTFSALQHLKKAEKSRASQLVRESVKVMRIYLDAKTLPYNKKYEKKLLGQLEWLDSQIEERLSKEIRKTGLGEYALKNGVSFYYWNDMMRRIVLAEICPRMLIAGKPVRALQLANMAENRLFGLVDKMPNYQWQGDSLVCKEYTLKEYRYSPNYNEIDYQNHFFEMIDSIGVDIAIEYMSNVKSPKSKFDHFLNNRSYTGDDYLNDIIGTQCLRRMRYADAVKYLSAVSAQYKDHLNVKMIYDPFSLKRKQKSAEGNFRLEFAKEMLSLEQEMLLTVDANAKARKILRYAVGLRNSFERCWSLTQYYNGTCYWGQVCKKRDWQNDRLTQAALHISQNLCQMACDVAKDPNVAAELQYELCNFKTVAKKYADTAKGRLVRGSCDRLRDYHAERPTKKESSERERDKSDINP